MVSAELVARVTETLVGSPRVVALLAADVGSLALILVDAGHLVVCQGESWTAGALGTTPLGAALVLAAPIVHRTRVFFKAGAAVTPQPVPASPPPQHHYTTTTTTTAPLSSPPLN